MKPSTHAPFFACLYAALCDTARANGYALAIHGTVTTDCDLIAVPWTETACEPEKLMQELMQHIGAVDYRGLLKRDCSSWATEKDIDQMVKGEHERIGDPRGPLDCAIKPHGRKAWNLYLEHGCKYGHEECPVTSGVIIQEYPCEECSWDNENPLEQKVAQLECTLRDIALYLGVGGYNCDTVDPQKFFDKIKWGINNFAESYHELQKTLENKRFKEQCAAITADALSD